MDKLQAKLILNLTGSTSYYLWNGTEEYYKKLRKAYLDLKSTDHTEYLYFAFFTLSAATMEYSLNYIIAEYCVSKFNPENYKRYCEEYIGLKFRSKLFMLPHIISEGKFSMNEEHHSFKLLEELITLRNRILHNKEYLREFSLPLNGQLDSDVLTFPSKENQINFELKIDTNFIDTLTKEKCLEFAVALGDFKELIMMPALTNGLNENAMLLKNY
mgnify:FL=1